AEGAPDSALGRALADGAELDGKAVTDAALAGDETARRVLELIGRRLGVALSSLANAFDPEVIVIGGGAIGAGELLVEPALAVHSVRPTWWPARTRGARACSTSVWTSRARASCRTTRATNPSERCSSPSRSSGEPR